MEQYNKYRASDIFNLNSTNSQTPLYQTSKRKPVQRTLEKTKTDIFNTGISTPSNVHSQKKRKQNFLKFYQSNIFNTKKPEDKNKNIFNKKRLTINTTSSCFESMQNNNQYKDDLKNYTQKHRPVLEDYNPDKYYGYDNASERYYTQIYGNNNLQNGKNKTINTELDKNKKLFSEKKIALKNQRNKRPKNFTIDEKKDFRKKVINWNEDNSNRYKYIESEGNNLHIAKLNHYLNLQSNIFKYNDNNNINILNDKKNNIILKTENNNNEINDNKELTNNIREKEKEINENKNNENNNENYSSKNDDKTQKNEEEKGKNNIMEERKANNNSSSIYKKRLINKTLNIKKKPKEKKNEKQSVNIQKYKDYNEHNFTISYGTKKNDFEKYSESDIKEIFAKRGIHIYDVKKQQFDNGVYNSFGFRVRENEGDNILQNKIKAVQNDLIKKNYLVSIKERDNQAKKRKDLEKVLREEGKKHQKIGKSGKNTKK